MTQKPVNPRLPLRKVQNDRPSQRKQFVERKEVPRLLSSAEQSSVASQQRGPVPRQTNGWSRYRHVPVWKFEDFHVGALLGRSIYQVIKAKHISGAVVALKRIPLETIRSEEDARRLTKEITIHSCLSTISPSTISRLFGFFFDSRNVFLVVELASHGDLKRCLEASPNKRLDEPQTAHIVRCVAKALHQCHAIGVAHRDVKPENILCGIFDNSDGFVAKLADFGAADLAYTYGNVPEHRRSKRHSRLDKQFKQTENNRRVIATNADELIALAKPNGCVLRPRTGRKVPRLKEICGTYDFMSPEVLAHDNATQNERSSPLQALAKVYDERCDMWALGCVIYECLIGKPPFQSADIIETKQKICAGEFWFPHSPRLTPECRLLIKALLRLDPSKRPSAKDVLKSSWVRRNCRGNNSSVSWGK